MCYLHGQLIYKFSQAFKFKETFIPEFYLGKPWSIITCNFYF